MASRIMLTRHDAACPFCGAAPEEVWCGPEDDEWAVECGKCGAMGPPMRDPADAIDEWNDRRVDQPGPEAA